MEAASLPACLPAVACSAPGQSWLAQGGAVWRGVADQLRRASKAVCALLVEGAGRQSGSDAEFRRYLVMAAGSADEARLWCDYAADLGYARPDEAQAWRDELREIARMLQGLRRQMSEN